MPSDEILLGFSAEAALIKLHLPAHTRISGHMAAILLREELMKARLIRRADTLPVRLRQALGHLIGGGELLGLRSGQRSSAGRQQAGEGKEKET